MATTPPILQVSTAKEKKYDRQLRLWAASGQAALEDAHLLLVNSGSGVVGIETLKNLVLPGVGQFTILDATVVQEEDLGVNFFLDEQSLGKPRAEETCQYLQELNPDVRGHVITEPAETFLTTPNSLNPYSHILVVSPTKSKTLTIISEHAAQMQKPVFHIHCIGFYACFSIYLPSVFPIVDTHPDPVSTTDLRLLKPFPLLSKFAAERANGLEAMDDHDHGHVPYLVLLLHYLEEWKRTHEGKHPTAYKEKQEYRDLVRQGMRTKNAEGGEENFEEAVSNVLKSLNEPTASSATKEVFTASECQNLTKESASFWIIAHAIAEFYKDEGVLPLPGSIPDMKAQSAEYVALQSVYKSKAREDIQKVLSTVRNTEKQLNRTDPIDEVEVEAFCKNAAHIKLVRGRPFHITQHPSKQLFWGERAKFAANALTDESSLVLLYIAFLAYDMFHMMHSSPPGLSSVDGDLEEIIGLGIGFVDDLLNESGRSLVKEERDELRTRLGEYCHEITRAGGAELHNIAALAGGLIAQEVIKVVTKQYIPVDCVCLFDGVKSVTSVLKV